MTFKAKLFAPTALIRGTVLKFLLLALLAASAWPADQLPSAATPLPQDTGIAGLKQELIRLHTTARLMHTDAHPDDEDGGMLVLESRGRGADVLLLTLNRGEGGQNKIGSNLFDVLGVVRTLELLAADRYYDAQQRFTHVADFGFTKTPVETFEKWQGHDPALSDIVRVIRTFRPDVLVSRFQGTERDGHGQHQVAGILTREAFRAAADPKRFPEQIKEGLQPWQAKKLYIDNVRPPMSTQTPKPEDYTLALDTGSFDPALGTSYVQFAMQGLKHQLSQGAGSWNIQTGPHISYYKLVDSVLPPLAPGTHEKDFFDGIDTSIAGMAAGLGVQESRVPFLRGALEKMQSSIDQATTAASTDPKSAAPALLTGLRLCEELLSQIQSSSLSPVLRDEVLTKLQTKQDQFTKAANLALGLTMQATVDAPPEVREGFMAVPGEVFTATATIKSTIKKMTGADFKISAIQMDVPPGWTAKRISPIANQGGNISARFQLAVPQEAPYTRPCERRPNAEAAVYSVTDPACAVLPVSPAPVHAVATYTLSSGQSGRIETPVEVEFLQGAGIVSRRPLAVGPRFSVAVSPAMVVVPTGSTRPVKLEVEGRSNLPREADAQIALDLPPGWNSDPQSIAAHFAKPGENKLYEFSLMPPSDLREGRGQVKAVLKADGKEYAEGYT
ncbi:MAG TPA: PIG-L family deacetylase, partial [Terriglobales bacterium]|nr:PIG-L family deacetylase [Terriglobales bacterium]